MEEKHIYSNSGEQEEDKLDFSELFFKYFMYWPWFAGAIMACAIAAWIYLRMTTPVYNVTATVLIKDDKKGGSSGMANELDNIGLGSVLSSSQNIDNEIEVLKSKTLVKDVVELLNLYIIYKNEDYIPAQELYLNSPVRVSFTPQEAEKLNTPLKVSMKRLPKGALDVMVDNNGEQLEKHFDKLPAVLPTEVGTLAFTFAPDSVPTADVQEIEAVISRPMSVTKSYVANLSIEPTSKTTSVATVSLKSTSTARGKDFINKLLEVYNINTNNDKNEVAQKTAEFINERILIISKELGSTEKDLETFKRQAGITDLSSDAQLALSGNAEYEKKKVDNQTQINLVTDLQKYMHDKQYEVLPSNIGLQNAILSDNIDNYNSMLIERKRLLRTSTENNPTIINLDVSIQSMADNLRVSLDRVLRTLQITKAEIDREANRYTSRINDAPGQERELVGIKRQQEIKANLYLMLLQKREENAITLAATANNAKIIDDALADEIPVSPKGKMIYLVAIVLGIAIPVGIIYLIDLTRFKIETRTDVEKITHLPIVGDIPLVDNLKETHSSIVVFENENTMMSETFRSIRTNLQFMLKPKENVILVTSTIAHEGKSFFSANLGISLSLLGKRVVIVGLDIRKPGLNKVFNISRKEEGITQFLSDPSVDLIGLAQRIEKNPNLYVLPGGMVPPNPTELLARDSLDMAIDKLKNEFDFVILDTAPVGMVTDTLLIGRTADLSVYTCRAEYTHKSEFTLINELDSEKKLPNICVILNGLDTSKKKFGYYYGYGKYGQYGRYNSTGRKYGYGYGYGEKEEKKKKKEIKN
ncbi:MAG: polysaccharide biosynthesis tyrosine autokinase [Mediterranea sp.]|jgi:capsular exopolysaccharide synthesis family protein|nr:polysaccharide biosynthesis tyrosine autokinase [Mediterranea sp.]